MKVADNVLVCINFPKDEYSSLVFGSCVFLRALEEERQQWNQVVEEANTGDAKGSKQAQDKKSKSGRVHGNEQKHVR